MYNVNTNMLNVNILKFVAYLAVVSITNSTFDVGSFVQQLTPSHGAAPLAYASMLAQTRGLEPIATDVSSPAVASAIATAKRLSSRILKNDGVTIPLSQAVQAVQERRALLRVSAQISFHVDDGTTVDPWIVSPSAYPLWVQPVLGHGTFSFVIDEERVRSTLAEQLPVLFPPSVVSTITAVVDDNGVLRVSSDHPAEPGYDVDIEVAAKGVLAALTYSGTGISLDVTSVPGSIVNGTGQEIGPLQHLATGRSDFRGSGGGRIANVRKGLSDYVDNVLIPPGASASFNAIVKNMSGGDWQDALVIMNGKDLVSFPGGGICQVATTVYRAALNSGLPIEQRANHSLYVTYYEKYGLGIDATVFPRKQDLVFVNNTNGHILVQAYSKGTEAFVHFYGAPDGRAVVMNGPYLTGTESETLTQLLGRTLARNEIAWVRHLTRADGTKSDDLVVSRYLSIPKKLHTEYASKPGGSMLADLSQ